MGVLDCEWASSCFKCRYNWCRKYCAGPRNNLHLSDADMIIATFPNRDYGYYKEKDLKDLAKRLNATEADVLKAANTDGWLDGVLLMWVKDKPELITKVRAFWPDGRTMLFENTTKVAEYFCVSPAAQVIGDKARGRNIYKGALLVKFDTPPSEDELIILRRNVPPVGDIPAPTAQEQEAIARANEARKGMHGNGKVIHIRCEWKTGEQIWIDTMGLMEDVLRISPNLFNKYVRSGEPYRGVTFTRLESEHEA